MNESEARWPSAWVRASLEVAILGALQGGELHGYAIAALLDEQGMGRLKGGSLYPVLARLEQDALVEAVWQLGESGPGRKAYAITDRGRDAHQRQLADWTELTRTLERLGRTEQEY